MVVQYALCISHAGTDRERGVGEDVLNRVHGSREGRHKEITEGVSITDMTTTQKERLGIMLGVLGILISLVLIARGTGII